jgi:triosephosphate isomerase
MYFDHHATVAWARQIAQSVQASRTVQAANQDGASAVEVVVMPSFPSLAAVALVLAGSGVRLGAQDLSQHDEGPYTGEVAGAALRQIGCAYVEVGHAERRRLHGESNTIAGLKLAAAWRAGLTPLLCLGETGPGDAAGRYCIEQLDQALAQVAPEHRCQPLVIAYEPVWAIGAHAPAPAGYAEAVCLELREHMAHNHPHHPVRLVYGGAAGPGTLQALERAVDGLFLGRFAHQPGSFEVILAEASALAGASAFAGRHT